MRLSHSHWFKEGKQESKTLQHLVYYLFVSVPTFEIILESIALQCSSLWICLCTVVVELVLLIVIHIDSVVCSGKLAGYISKTHPMVYSWKMFLHVNAGICFPLGRTGDLVDIILAFFFPGQTPKSRSAVCHLHWTTFMPGNRTLLSSSCQFWIKLFHYVCSSCETEWLQL